MHTNISGQNFLLVETEHSKLLDVNEHHRIKEYFEEHYNFILWKNEGEYAVISKAQIKEALRVHEELNSAPDDHLSTAGFPSIYWDDCLIIDDGFSLDHVTAEILLGEERQLYREAEKPEDGSDR